jgi:hypothetical protein
MKLARAAADGGYAGKLEEFVQRTGSSAMSFGLGIIKKLEDFIVLPRRWVIERSFGWLVSIFPRPDTPKPWCPLSLLNLIRYRLALNLDVGKIRSECLKKHLWAKPLKGRGNKKSEHCVSTARRLTRLTVTVRYPVSK